MFLGRSADALAKTKNLKKEYPELANVNGNMKLGTLREQLGVNSLSQALKTLRKRS